MNNIYFVSIWRRGGLMNCNDQISQNVVNDPTSDVSNVLIIQCKNCRTIIGDTNSISHMDASSRTITLNSMIYLF